jgi:thermostable 8-oxoguanine DNA glycosylase
MKIKEIEKYIQLYDIEKYLFKIIGPKVKEKGFLSFEDFYQISMWKSVRQKQNYLKNKDIVEKISKKAFEEKDEFEKIKILCELKGVGIPTASAILTIIYPEKYAVIDIRCLETLNKIFGFKIKKSMSTNTWVNYLDIMRTLAKENNVTPRELDMALFAMHKESLEKQNHKNLY